MIEKQRLFRIHGNVASYEGLIRLYEEYEGNIVMTAIVDVTNELSGKKRVLNMRNDRAPRLEGTQLQDYQGALIQECMDILNESEESIANSVEVKKIGARVDVDILDYYKSEKSEAE